MECVPGCGSAVSAFTIVERQIAIQAVLKLGDGFIQRVTKSRREKLFLDGAMESFAEAVGLWWAHFCAAMHDLANGEERSKWRPQYSLPLSVSRCSTSALWSS